MAYSLIYMAEYAPQRGGNLHLDTLPEVMSVPGIAEFDDIELFLVHPKTEKTLTPDVPTLSGALVSPSERPAGIRVGEGIHLLGEKSIHTSAVQRIRQAQNGVFYIYTRNSIYRVQLPLRETAGPGMLHTLTETFQSLFKKVFPAHATPPSQTAAR